MRLLGSIRFSLGLICLGLLTTHCASAGSLHGRVVAIADGDTITLLDGQRQQHKVRLAGIDAPEKKQPFGQASKKRLSDMVYGRDVILECGKIDKYRREVCVIYIDGRDINLAQIEVGMAWWYKQYKREQTAQQRANYEAAESLAREQRVGLWSNAEPVAPWEFRRAK